MHKSVMNRVAFMALLLVFACGAAQAAAMKAKLSKIKGDVQVKTSATAAWKAAAAGQTISESAQIKTGAGSEVFVAWGSGHVLKVSASSQVTLASLTKSESGSQSNNVKLEKGKVMAKAGKLSAGSNFNITTPTAVAGVRGTGFECSENNVAVVDGNVEVTAGGVTIELEAGMSTEITEFGEPPSEPAPIPADTLADLKEDFNDASDVSEAFIEEFGDEGESLDAEDAEDDDGEGMTEDDEDSDEEMDEEMEMDEEDASDDVIDSVDSALDESILEDIVDAAEEGDFLPGTGGIQGYIEY